MRGEVRTRTSESGSLARRTVSLPLVSPHIMLSLALTALSLAASLGENYRPVEVTRLAMPKYGLEGGEVVMSCDFTSFHPVYSVKWYQSGKEFFR